MNNCEAPPIFLIVLFGSTMSINSLLLLFTRKVPPWYDGRRCEMGRVASYLRVNFFLEVDVIVAVVVIAGYFCYSGEVDSYRRDSIRL